MARFTSHFYFKREGEGFRSKYFETLKKKKTLHNGYGFLERNSFLFTSFRLVFFSSYLNYSRNNWIKAKIVKFNFKLFRITHEIPVVNNP